MNIFSVKKDEKKRINKNNKINTVFLLIKNVSLLINKTHKINTDQVLM